GVAMKGIDASPKARAAETGWGRAPYDLEQNDPEGDAMSSGTTPATSERPEFIGAGARRSRRWWVIVAAVLVLIAAGALTVDSDVFDRSGDNSSPDDKGSATSLATVQRRSLSRQTQFNGTLGYAGSYTVMAHVQGTVTWLPSIGQVIHDGQVVFR